MIISSHRLDLVPMSAAFLRASLHGDAGEAERIAGVSIPADWPDIPTVLSLRLRQLEADPALAPWLLRAMILRDTRTMIGHIGFHTAPAPDYLASISPGAIELGFTVFPAFQRRGFAREAALALMDWARTAHGLRAFIFSIRPDNTASQALAAQLGFVRIGSHEDEEDGTEDILELTGPPKNPG